MGDNNMQPNDRGGPLGWLGHLLSLPGEALAYAIGKWNASHISKEMLQSAEPLQLAPAAVARLTESLLKLESEIKAVKVVVASDTALQAWSPEELMLIERIQMETTEANRNNVTRTEAYRNVYFRTPELHWALLAHLVSRNGGWNMTDLQGEWLPRLLTEAQRLDVFLFLERANALIFQDAYPQLLLYQWSRSQNRSLFHLLPAFGVSAFMIPVWRQFWREGDSAILTTALIVNEQYFIEGRVVRNDYFEKHVLQTMFFGLQSLLQLNGVLFPYGSGREDTGEQLQLAGLILENFQNVHERIEFGKRLYAMLFGIPRVFAGAKCFAAAVKHTGSRSDYSPALFHSVRKNPPRRIYEEKLLGGRLKSGASPIYSPSLQSAWKDHPIESHDTTDWFLSSETVLGYFHTLPFPQTFEITNEYGLMLSKLELAVLAAQRGKSSGN
ncbi:DUF2515 domain-containing protein [Paenibacillus sp. GSMTC-2017]|uniref:DUF2515 domain-containing protein n=1 Tax=Paenibacillus sp. GSMTC-2017 TaxID=2794350 RepID=UPI0018D7572F|nr:DUF2515 domain-containing protein [Paenibacillus sp. GSMTC-2017]MBH5316738.1 DUF2515 domain-containing protein [Paenibacillus sp. GSMTC-2017]